MSQVGAPVRIVALIGMLAALGVGAWTFTLGHSSGSTAADQPAALGSVGQNPIAAAQAAANGLSAHNTATAHGAAAAAAAAKPKTAKPAAAAAAPKPAVTTPAATAAPATKAPAAKPKKKAATTTKDGTPLTIASLLRTHTSVVVLLYDAQAQVDQYSIAEAKLGASRAHAGFITVNVMNQRETAPFTKAYGVLQDPTVLFFSRPGKLVQKISGFADHDTVAQAAINAALGLGATQG